MKSFKQILTEKLAQKTLLMNKTFEESWKNF